MKFCTNFCIFNRNRGPSRRTDYRIVVRGLPESGSWQDLKDHMREAGDVSFTDVIHEGDEKIGIVEFFNKDDMSYKKLEKGITGMIFRNLGFFKDFKEF